MRRFILSPQKLIYQVIDALALTYAEFLIVLLVLLCWLLVMSPVAL
ncbi:hypothetical protein [Leptolyngbya sp. 'hensonii']|nr:hypothetical protein [Leptolyngbya sp. 'hensonii']